MALGLKFVRATKQHFGLCALSQVIPTMITKTPNTRKKFRRAKLQMQALKALESVVPNKQVGKWSDLLKMFTKNKK